MRRFGLRADAAPQTYALGLKEVWEVRCRARQPTSAPHSLGPLGEEQSAHVSKPWPLYGDGRAAHQRRSAARVCLFQPADALAAAREPEHALLGFA